MEKKGDEASFEYVIVIMSLLVRVVYWACKRPLGVLSLREVVECSIFDVV